MKLENQYIDRESGQVKYEEIHANNFLNWSYNTTTGRWATNLMFNHRWVSVIYGWWHKKQRSQRKIAPFVERMRIDMSESLRPIDDYSSFNDFFTREIDLTKRSINMQPGVCIAPCDGKVLAYPSVKSNERFPIKRHSFNLQEFLRDDNLVLEFDGASLVISRLALVDYHHFHFPDDGIPQTENSIQGKYHAGGPYSLRNILPFYSENYRVLTVFNSIHYGRMLIMEIGAFTVGSIQQRFTPGEHVQKGTPKGFFELGGSTVALLFRKSTITLDDDLLINTASGIETYVRFGDSIGRA